jgi:transcriptional regulator with XRE-family HTH domain
MILSGNINNWYSMSDSAIVKEIGKLVKQTRLQKNITQQQLADKVGLYRSTISEMENGRAASLLSFIQVMRGLDKLEILDFLSAVPAVSPLKLAKSKGLFRKRASVTKNNDSRLPEESTW